MKYVRWLIPLVLLAVAAPAFAICGLCDELNNCNYLPGMGIGCHYRLGQDCTIICVEMPNTNCNPNFGASFSSTYRIQSVTVSDANALPVAQKSPVVAPDKMKKTT